MTHIDGLWTEEEKDAILSVQRMMKVCLGVGIRCPGCEKFHADHPCYPGCDK